MRYFLIISALLVSINTFSFAKYNWSKKNRLASVGAILVALVSILLPVILTF